MAAVREPDSLPVPLSVLDAAACAAAVQYRDPRACLANKVHRVQECSDPSDSSIGCPVFLVADTMKSDKRRQVVDDFLTDIQARRRADQKHAAANPQQEDRRPWEEKSDDLPLIIAFDGFHNIGDCNGELSGTGFRDCNGQVHSGWWKQVQKLPVLEIANHVVQLGRRVVISGRCYGGAAATLFTARLLQELRRVHENGGVRWFDHQVTLITFGAVPVGDLYFKLWMQRACAFKQDGDLPDVQVAELHHLVGAKDFAPSLAAMIESVRSSRSVPMLEIASLALGAMHEIQAAGRTASNPVDQALNRQGATKMFEKLSREQQEALVRRFAPLPGQTYEILQSGVHYHVRLVHDRDNEVLNAPPKEFVSNWADASSASNFLQSHSSNWMQRALVELHPPAKAMQLAPAPQPLCMERLRSRCLPSLLT